MERGAYALWKESTTHVILSLEFLTWWIIQDSWVRSLKHWALLRKYDSSKNEPYPTLEVFILFDVSSHVCVKSSVEIFRWFMILFAFI